MVLRKAWEDSRIPQVEGECAENAVGVGVDALKLRLNQEDGPSWHVEDILEGQRNLKGKSKRSNLVLLSVGSWMRAFVLRRWVDRGRPWTGEILGLTSVRAHGYEVASLLTGVNALDGRIFEFVGIRGGFRDDSEEVEEKASGRRMSGLGKAR